MNNSTNIISEFNNTLDEFINKMIIQFPQETKLKTYYSAFKVTKMYDKTIPSRSIYIPSHKYYTGQPITYNVGLGGTGIIDLTPVVF